MAGKTISKSTRSTAKAASDKNLAEESAFSKIWNWYKDRRRKKKEQKKKPQTIGEALWSWTKTLVGAFIVVMIINGLAIASFVVPTGSMENTVMTGDFLFVNKFIFGPSTPQVIPFANVPLPFYKFPGFRDPHRGDVIVFIFPGSRDQVKADEFQYYLKRCVAVAGDTVRIIDNQLYVNGIAQPLPPNGRIGNELWSPARDREETFPYGKNYTRSNYGPLRIPKEGDVVHLTPENYREWDTFIRREGHDFKYRGGVFYIDDEQKNTYVVERNYVFGMGDNRLNSADSRFWGFVPVENIVGTPLIVYWSWDTNLPLSDIFKKFATVRWARLGKIIK